jgi:hypothetical protein
MMKGRYARGSNLLDQGCDNSVDLDFPLKPGSQVVIELLDHVCDNSLDLDLPVYPGSQ